MVRTQDLVQHIIKVSHGQGMQDQDIKYEHMVRELGNISKTVLQHSGDPGLRLCSCVSLLAWPGHANTSPRPRVTFRLLPVSLLPRRCRMQAALACTELPLPCCLCLSTGSCVCVCVWLHVWDADARQGWRWEG